MTELPSDLIPEGREKYAELAAKLSTRGELTPFQRDLIRVYADNFGIRARALTDLRAGALVVTGSNGNAYPNPALKVIQQAETCMDRCLRRLHVAADELSGPGSALREFLAEDDGFDEFCASKPGDE